MCKSIVVALFMIFRLCAAGQPSDFILLKKKNETVATYFAGSNIQFISTTGAYRDAVITAIRNDSIYLREYLVRQVPTTLGFSIADTVGSFRYVYHYNQVAEIGKPRKGFNVSGSGSAFLGGSILLVLGSGVVYLTDREKFSPGLMGAAAALGLAGYFMGRSASKGIVIGKKNYSLLYMPVGGTK